VAAPTELNAEQFFLWTPPTSRSDRRFELECGRIIEVPLTGVQHGVVCASLLTVLWNFAARRKKGYPCSNGPALIVARNPDTVRCPDLLFCEDDNRGSVDILRRAGAEEIPDLVVEVLSPHDTENAMAGRVREFLEFGVPLVWIVNPATRAVQVHRAGKGSHTLQEADELTGDDVLADFRCNVAELFKLPGE
jgi:Uma2 family endonuclease